MLLKVSVFYTQKYIQKSFIIVEFLNEFDEDWKKIVDLVPLSWIGTSRPSPVCLFSMQGGSKLQQLVKLQISLNSPWKEYKIAYKFCKEQVIFFKLDL